jgi:hypothetical protein
MPLMKITGPGLVAIGCSVALLWACILGERMTMRWAYSERAAVMRSLARDRAIRHAEPALAPRPLPGIRRHYGVG